MKHVHWISLLLASVLTVCCLASCGSPAAETEPLSGETAVGSVSAAAEDATTAALPTEPETKAEKTTKPEKTTKAKKTTTQTEPDAEKMFSYGLWNDGSHLEYNFGSDGTGTCTDTKQNTTETFRFEVNEKKGTVTFYMGEKPKKQKADYRHVDDTHLTLTFSKTETVALTYGALLRKDDLPFRMGTWKSTNEELYIFRPDGSGKITSSAEGAADTSFRYEVNPENSLIILHIGSDDDLRPAVYMLTEDGLHMTIAFEYDHLELTWQNKSTE